MKFSKHAHERITQSPVKHSWVKKLYARALPMRLDRDLLKRKLQKYGNKPMLYKQVSVDVIFTVDIKNDEIVTFTVVDKGTKKVLRTDTLHHFTGE